MTRLLQLLALCVFVAGCGGESEEPTPEEPTPVNDIEDKAVAQTAETTAPDPLPEETSEEVADRYFNFFEELEAEQAAEEAERALSREQRREERSRAKEARQRDAEEARQRYLEEVRRQASAEAEKRAAEEAARMSVRETELPRTGRRAEERPAGRTAEIPTHANRTQRNRSSDFAVKTRDVAGRAIRRLRTEEEGSHLAIEAEAKEDLAVLVESDPRGAIVALMVGDTGPSALAGAGWAALADDRDRVDAVLAALGPAATLQDLAVAVSGAKIDPVEIDPTLSPQDVKMFTSAIITEVGGRLQQVGNSAYIGTEIRALAEDEPAASQLYARLIDVFARDGLTAMSVEIAIRNPGVTGHLARSVARLTGMGGSVTQRSGLAAIASEVRSEPVAEETTLSAFIALVNRYGVATSTERTNMLAALGAESDDVAVEVLTELALPLLEKSLRAVLNEPE